MKGFNTGIVECNAKITSTMLGIEDHGVLTVYLTLDYGGAGQGFGGHVLDGPYDEATKRRADSAAFALYVRRVMEVVGVNSWEALKGQFCRVRQSHSKVHAIGNLLEDKWFFPEEELKAFLGEPRP